MTDDIELATKAVMAALAGNALRTGPSHYHRNKLRQRLGRGVIAEHISSGSWLYHGGQTHQELAPNPYRDCSAAIVERALEALTQDGFLSSKQWSVGTHMATGYSLTSKGLQFIQNYDAPMADAAAHALGLSLGEAGANKEFPEDYRGVERMAKMYAETMFPEPSSRRR